MKSKLKALFWGVFSIPSIILLYSIYFNVNSWLESLAITWYITQLLIVPLCLTIINLLKK